MGVEDLVTKSLDIQSDLDIYHGVPLRQRILAHAGSALLKCLLGRRARAMLSLEETFLREKARERRRLEREALGVDLKAVLDGDGAKDVAVAKGRGL